MSDELTTTAVESEEMEEPCEADIGLTDEEVEETEGDNEATRATFAQLPSSGVGFYSYAQFRYKQFGHPNTIQALVRIAAAWNKAHPSGSRIGIGNISLQRGGKMNPHVSHQNGRDVDIRLVTNNSKEIGLTYKNAAYSRSLTQELVNLIRSSSVAGLNVRTILVNDSKVGGVTFFRGHDDHLHVSFLPSTVPIASATTSTDKKQLLRLVVPNMKGNSVQKVQDALIKKGITVATDGIFGPNTEDAVKKFQQASGLKADGIVGLKTLEKLGVTLS